MSALGQKQTSGHVRVMSALPPKADIDQSGCDVRFVPTAGGLWIAERFLGAALQADGETGSPLYGPQASEGEAQHGLFCWTGRIGQGHERLHCG